MASLKCGYVDRNILRSLNSSRAHHSRLCVKLPHISTPCVKLKNYSTRDFPIPKVLPKPQLLHDVASTYERVILMQHTRGIFLHVDCVPFWDATPSTGSQPRRIFDHCVPKEKRAFVQKKKIRGKMKRCKKEFFSLRI